MTVPASPDPGAEFMHWCGICDGFGNHEGVQCKNCGGKGYRLSRVTISRDSRDSKPAAKDCTYCRDWGPELEGVTCGPCGRDSRVRAELIDEDQREPETSAGWFWYGFACGFGCCLFWVFVGLAFFVGGE